MLLALALLLVALASAQTTTAVSITTTTTTPVATTAVNVSCDPGLCNYDGNGHGSCEDDLCLCDYGWMGPSCMFPAASGRWATWTFIASVFGVAIPTLVALAALGETYLYLRKHWGALTRAKVPPLITLCALSTGAFARTFYYSLDPFSWRSTVEVCSMWAIDYISTAFVAASFFFVLHGWAAVMGKFEQLNGRRFVFVLLWQWLPMYCLLASGLVVLLTVPGSFLSCHCKDYNCSSTLGDYVFYLPWLVLFGLCLILCVLAGGFMVLQLRRFGINDSHHFTRVFRYSLFVLVRVSISFYVVSLNVVFFLSAVCDCGHIHSRIWHRCADTAQEPHSRCVSGHRGAERGGSGPADGRGAAGQLSRHSQASQAQRRCHGGGCVGSCRRRVALCHSRQRLAARGNRLGPREQLRRLALSLPPTRRPEMNNRNQLRPGSPQLRQRTALALLVLSRVAFFVPGVIVLKNERV